MPAKRGIVRLLLLGLLLWSGPSVGFGHRAESAAGPAADPWTGEDPPEQLSAFGLFRGNGATQEPAADVVPYDVNTPLFSDYALKYRFVHVPRGTKAKYNDTEVLDFPIGTILIKTFAYANDERDLSKGRRLVETRLLVRRPEGWVGLPYVWNDQQTEAVLKVAGVTRPVHRIDKDGKESTLRYSVPNTNQCMGCHENTKIMRPIGPTARGLNRRFDYVDGSDNQLAHWTKIGILEGAPAPANTPKMAVWNDPSTGSVRDRARAWLEANCAHCHNPAGPARTSGLDLRVIQLDAAKGGVWKTPIAAGRGSGGRWYDIIPGKPDDSILIYRIESTEPGVMMPELSRKLVDHEGLALIREWIASMPDTKKR
jgi:uncharacterized repeat protein (TIGR03806 family)